jgi:hypothetical protein
LVTSRERVKAAFDHTCPDRTPIWEKLVKSPIADQLLGRPSAAENFTYRMERLADGDWTGLTLQAARDLVDLAVLLGFDLIRLYPNPPPPHDRPVRLPDGGWRVGNVHYERLSSGWVRTWVPGGRTPSAEEQEVALRQELHEPAGSPPAWDDDSFLMMREARRLMAEGGLDLPIFCAAYTMGVATQPEFFLRWFATDRALVHEYYSRQREAGLHLAHKLVAEGADIIGLGGDLASDHGPICSPRDYGEFVAPSIGVQAAAMRARGVYTTNASDGDLSSVLDAFLLTAQVDGFEEIDFAAGMDLRRLRQDYPGKTFVGNIDIRHTLTSGTVAQVQEHSRRCLEAGLGDGGHIVMSSNCIHEGVKLELFLAHLQAYREYFGIG